MTTPAASAAPLAAHARLIRAAADLLEQAGIPGLAIWPGPDQIQIQVPEHCGDLAACFRGARRLNDLGDGHALPPLGVERGHDSADGREAPRLTF